MRRITDRLCALAFILWPPFGFAEFPVEATFPVSQTVRSQTLGGALRLEFGYMVIPGLNVKPVSDVGADGDSNIPVTENPQFSGGQKASFFLSLGLLSWLDLLVFSEGGGGRLQILGENAIPLGKWFLNIHYLQLKGDYSGAKTGGGLFSPDRRNWDLGLEGQSIGAQLGYSLKESFDLFLRVYQASGDLEGSVSKFSNSNLYASSQLDYAVKALGTGVGITWSFGAEDRWALSLAGDSIKASSNGFSKTQTVLSAAISYRLDYFNNLIR